MLICHRSLPEPTKGDGYYMIEGVAHKCFQAQKGSLAITILSIA
jgi:hypothetical protein